ncbi:hypothetical protein [Streptomyces sp. NBC_01092]|nr:hypothetical protein OG254_07230 [Streptomyces sp. NBC_01092]
MSPFSGVARPGTGPFFAFEHPPFGFALVVGVAVAAVLHLLLRGR